MTRRGKQITPITVSLEADSFVNTQLNWKQLKTTYKKQFENNANHNRPERIVDKILALEEVC